MIGDAGGAIGARPSVATAWVSLISRDDRPLFDAPLTVDGALEFARNWRAEDRVGNGISAIWELLATLGCADLGVARAIEPHLDAQSILSGARSSGFGGTSAAPEVWGVFAAEGGPEPLRASLSDSAWVLHGTKPWCSLADRLDRALVTAKGEDGARRLFAVDLRDPGVRVEEGTWHARGLSEIPSGPVHFSAVTAEPVGPPGWYLERIGFAWGGIGVAACWYGGAVGLARSLFDSLAASDPSALQLAHLGAVDEVIRSARLSLLDAARIVDSDATSTRDSASVLAKRVRGTVASACEEVLLRCGHALGPAPLALDPVHAKRVADLQLYIRQHHAEPDQASLGSALLARGGTPW